MMISSRSSWAQNVTTTNLDLNSPVIKKQIAEKMIDLQVCTQSKNTLQSAYDECALDTHGPLQFWQTPSFIVGGFVVTVTATIGVVCLTHFLGACQ
jgi:hypothetical protein